MFARFHRFQKPIWLAGLLLVAALVLSACQPAGLPDTGATPTTEASAATSAPTEMAAPTEAMATATSAPTEAARTEAPAPTEAAATAPAAATPTAEMAAEEEAELSVATHPDLGEILVGNNGMTLYMFTRDEPNQSNCSGDCLVNWPPLLTQGNPDLGEGIDPELVGTAEMPDGSMIVTYNQMPLYYWINDSEPGDATGQGVGGVWYVVGPDGNPIGQ